MLKNNNHAVVKRMAKNSVKYNRQRSLVMLLAVLLSSFMLFSVLTVGVTYFKLWNRQLLRMNGAKFDAIMYGCTDSQLQLLKENDEVEKLGMIAVVAEVTETKTMEVASVPLVWCDDVYWNELQKPLRTMETGHYPRKANEVMVTKNALKNAGLKGYGIGDRFTASWGHGDENDKSMEFEICGIWDGFGSKGQFFVSREFFEQSGAKMEQPGCGRVVFTMHSRIMTEKAQNEFIDSMGLGKGQRIYFSTGLGQSVPILLGLIGLTVIICFAAGLFIYNIMYLSITGNIRYYGQLRTIGMTGKQIYSYIYRQMFLLGAAGVLAGIVCAAGISFLVLPSLIRAFGITEKVTVTFQPLVFFGVLLLSFATIFISCKKPVKIAVSVSPVEASRYLAKTGKGKPVRIMGKGSLIWRMGMRKVVMNKKKTAVIMLSLAIGLSVFLCIITLVESQGARTMVSSAWNEDLNLTNSTLKSEKTEKWREILTDDFGKKIEETDGVKEVRFMLAAQIMIPWEKELSGPWLQEMYETYSDIDYAEVEPEYKENPKQYGSWLVGIDERDFPTLADSMEETLDKKEFDSGKSCVLYNPQLQFEAWNPVGKNVFLSEYKDAKNTCSFQVAGLTDSPEFSIPMTGAGTPVVIISKKVLEKLDFLTYHYKANVYYEKAYDRGTQREVEKLVEKLSDGKYLKQESKIGDFDEMKRTQGNLAGVGVGISVMLALIGIMNYINTMIGNIESRKRELEILENIGMTYRQMKKMLVREGVIYACGSLVLTFVLGLPVTWLLFSSVNYMNISFFIPWLPVVLFIAVVSAVCIFIPVFILKGIRRSAQKSKYVIKEADF